MYLTTAYRRVVALEPETGKCRWEYEIKKGEAATRGLEYWAGDANAAALVLRHLQRRIDRAFDSKTGKELWVTKIDAGAHSAPITYLGKDGKQYVVITATGGGFIADPSSADAVLAFALP